MGSTLRTVRWCTSLHTAHKGNVTCIKPFFSHGSSTRFREMTSSYWASRSPSLDTPHSIGLVGQVIGPTQRPVPDKAQHSLETNSYAPGGIQTRNPNSQLISDTRRRPRVHWGRHNKSQHPQSSFREKSLTSLDQIHHASVTRSSIRYSLKFREDVRLRRRNNCPAKQTLIKVERYSNTPKINHDAMTCNMRHEECPRSP